MVMRRTPDVLLAVISSSVLETTQSSAVIVILGQVGSMKTISVPIMLREAARIQCAPALPTL